MVSCTSFEASGKRDAAITDMVFPNNCFNSPAVTMRSLIPHSRTACVQASATIGVLSQSVPSTSNMIPSVYIISPVFVIPGLQSTKITHDSCIFICLTMHAAVVRRYYTLYHTQSSANNQALSPLTPIAGTAAHISVCCVLLL